MCSRISRAGNGSRKELEWQCIVLSHHSAEPQQDISVIVIFQVNWTLNGVDMTSQTYTHFIWAHMMDLVWRHLQTKSLI